MEIIHGSAVTIQALQANVILHVPEGVFGIILGNIHTNFRTFSHLVEENDCIISPMCEFELHNYNDIPKGAWYTIQVPHIVKNPSIESKIMIKHRDKYKKTFTHALRLLTGEPPTDDIVNVYYRFHDKYIEIFTHHFSQFIAYAENTTIKRVMGVSGIACCLNALRLLVFGIRHDLNFSSLIEIVVVLCSLQSKAESKQVSLHDDKCNNDSENDNNLLISNNIDALLGNCEKAEGQR